MDETRKLGRIAEEKDWGVIENPIEVPFFSLDLDREPLHIYVRQTRIPGPLLAKECLWRT